MELAKFLVIPLTPLHFGTYKPLEQGGYGETLYPLPHPSTVSGMIRTAIIDYYVSEHSYSIDKVFKEKVELVGKKGSYEGFNWVLIGPYLAKYNKSLSSAEVYYPAPGDLVVSDESYNPNSGALEKLFVLDKRSLIDARKNPSQLLVSKICNTPLPIPKGKYITYLNAHPNFIVKSLDAYISYKAMKQYLDDKLNVLYLKNNVVLSRDVVKITEDIHIEVKADTKIVNTRLVENKPKGMMYRVQRVIFKCNKDYCWGMTFAIYSEDDAVINEIKNILNGAVLRLGGEGGLVKIVSMDSLKILEDEERYTHKAGKVKLVLTSAAPIKKDLLKLKKCVGAVCGKTIISGYNLADRRPRSNLYALTRGSVIYLDLEDDSLDVFSRSYVLGGFSRIYGSALLGAF